MKETNLNQSDSGAIRELLLGHKVVKVDDDTLRLDNGTTLRLKGNEGGCSCNAGCYDLTVLNGIDNIITKVEYNFDPGGDDMNGDGVYEIFVFADNQKVNLATFAGTDGNGYYGTGFSINVTPMQDEPHNRSKVTRL